MRQLDNWIEVFIKQTWTFCHSYSNRLINESLFCSTAQHTFRSFQIKEYRHFQIHEYKLNAIYFSANKTWIYSKTFQWSTALCLGKPDMLEIARCKWTFGDLIIGDSPKNQLIDGIPIFNYIFQSFYQISGTHNFVQSQESREMILIWLVRHCHQMKLFQYLF